MPEYIDEYRIYRAKKSGDGVAMSFQPSVKNKAVFMEMARQNGNNKNGNAVFDWNRRLSFKLGIQDIGDLLAVLEGRVSGVGRKRQDGKYQGLFHRFKDGNSVLYFQSVDDGFGVCLSVKKGNSPARLKLTISDGEACVLRALLVAVLPRIVGWSAAV